LSTPIEIAALTRDQLQAAARERLAFGHGVALAVYKDALRYGRYQPERHGLAQRGVSAWREAFAFSLPSVARTVEEHAETGRTAKAVLRYADGLEAECVLLPMGRGRSTLCVSSQIGCKMGCSFCETARMGLLRHMTAAEIVAQLLVARHVLGWEFRNVVFMGMGEALDNPNLSAALAVLTDGSGLGMSQERITVCSVGNVEGIERLAQLGLKRLNLSISLNAANDLLRSELMPINRRVPLAALQAALLRYRPRPNFVLGVNYCLMPGLNASDEHAREVAAFCLPLGRVMVNVIPYNPGNVPLTRAPSDDEVVTFIERLRSHGLPVRRRITKGRSVMAACGQLGNVQLRVARRARGSVEQTPD
jgi:23S rRNA (adenine2503-C2)-methyltransferase